MKILVACLATLSSILLGCQNRTSGLTNGKDTLQVLPQEVPGSTMDLSTDYLKKCSELRIWMGFIAGVSRSDSIGPYYFAHCYDSAETFRLLWVPKASLEVRRNMTLDQKRSLFNQGKENEYSDFDIYCFVLPLVDSETMEDMHKDYTPYPVKVKVYKRSRNAWTEINTVTVQNLNQFGSLQLRTIFQ